MSVCLDVFMEGGPLPSIHTRYCLGSIMH